MPDSRNIAATEPIVAPNRNVAAQSGRRYRELAGNKFVDGGVDSGIFSADAEPVKKRKPREAQEKISRETGAPRPLRRHGTGEQAVGGAEEEIKEEANRIIERSAEWSQPVAIPSGPGNLWLA